MAYNRAYTPRPEGQRFRAQVSAWIKMTEVRANMVVRDLVELGLKTAVQETPVDTGRAAASWRLGKNRIDHSVDQRPARLGTDVQTFTKSSTEGDMVLRDQMRKAKGATIGAVWWITNNLHYIIPLEDGYSTKGRAMLQKAFGTCVAQFSSIVQRAKGKSRIGSVSSSVTT